MNEFNNQVLQGLLNSPVNFTWIWNNKNYQPDECIFKLMAVKTNSGGVAFVLSLFIFFLSFANRTDMNGYKKDKEKTTFCWKAKEKKPFGNPIQQFLD